MAMGMRERLAERAALEVKNGMVVNLGIGIPTAVADYIDESMHVMFHAEHGILGGGPHPDKGTEDPHLCNAGGIPITIKKGASFFDSVTSFGLIRRGLIDMTILGAFEVSQEGDLANWIVPGKIVSGMGGAMELAQKSKKVVVLMTHTDKHGNPKIVKSCSLPLTAKKCVDLIITNMGVIEVTDKGLVLKEVTEPYTVEDVVNSTEADLIVSSNLLK